MGTEVEPKHTGDHLKKQSPERVWFRMWLSGVAIVFVLYAVYWIARSVELALVDNIQVPPLSWIVKLAVDLGVEPDIPSISLFLALVSFYAVVALLWQLTAFDSLIHKLTFYLMKVPVIIMAMYMAKAVWWIVTELWNRVGPG